MAAPTLPELTERARDIFRLVVESYLENGQPVGSKTLAGAGHLDLSPASIRSVLAELEARGLLSAPHISAGRMPTDSGLRLFVDAMMQVAEPTEQERKAIKQRLGEAGPVERALEETSALLSDLTGAAGMVMVPRSQPKLAQVSLTKLDANRVLAVLVSEDGQIENRILPLAAAALSTSLEQASNYLTDRVRGRTLSDASRRIAREITGERSALDAASRDLVARGIATWTEDADERPILIVRGQANLLDDAALSDIERVRSLLGELENKQAVATLLDAARSAQATRIFIGSENPLFSLSGSSVIAAPYRDGEGRIVGVLGVIGPTRLNYARVVPMLDFTAHQLGKRFD